MSLCFLEVNGHQNYLVTNILLHSNILFYVNRIKGFKTSLKQHNWWHNIHFWVNYPFKILYTIIYYLKLPLNIICNTKNGLLKWKLITDVGHSERELWNWDIDVLKTDPT